jgi:hypothetical protein
MGPATCVGRTGELPIEVTLRRQHLLPGELYQAYGASVA